MISCAFVFTNDHDNARIQVHAFAKLAGDMHTIVEAALAPNNDIWTTGVASCDEPPFYWNVY
jgi:hypothetical protein